VTSRSDASDVIVTSKPSRDVIGQVVVAKADSLAPICALNFPVPAAEPGDVETLERDVDEEMIERLLRRKKKSSEVEVEAHDDIGGVVELRLTDVADMVHGDWQALATQLGLSDEDIDSILAQYHYPSEQVSHTGESYWLSGES